MDSTAFGKLLTPVVAAQDLEIDRIEIAAAGKRSVVRIFLDGDGPAGIGPSMDQITQATRSISVALDEADLTKGRAYTLEVSSRGVGRPLTEAKHFRRNRGRLVTITTADEPVTGRIVGVSDEVLELEVAGVVQEIALAAITTAQVQVEMNRSINKSDDEEEEV